MYLLARNRLSLVRHWDRILVVDERCGDVDNRRELHDIVHRERVGRLRIDEPAAARRQAVGLQDGKQPFVERALHEAQIALVLCILDLQVHLPERTGAAFALDGGQRLPEDRDEHLLV